MTARARVLAALGGRCVWCGSTTALEIDHLDGGAGQGNAHRAQLREPIERWVVREHQRTGVFPTALVQLLCHACHDAKSGRRPQVPAKHDTVRQNLSLPAPLVEGLKVVATQRGETLSALVAEAIQRLLDGGASQTLLESLHQRLDHHEARQRAVEATLATVVAGLVEVQDLLRTQGKDHARLVDAANCLYDYVDGRQGKALPVGSVLKQFFGARR